MVDAGGPGSVRKCPGVALADLDDVEGFDRSGEEDQLYAFQLSDGVYKRKKVHPSEGIGFLNFEELSDVNISHAVPRRLHSLAYTGSKWVPFADPLQQIGWLIDLKISSPFVATGKKTHKLQKVANSGTRLCSFIPQTRTVVVSEAPGQSCVLKTGNDKQGSLKMVSEFPQRESSVWGYLCRRSSLRSFLETGLTTLSMCYLA